MGELGALFNPGMRHEEEEQRAKQMLREEEGTGRKGRLNIDLSSGVVVIGSDTATERSTVGRSSAGDADGDVEPAAAVAQRAVAAAPTGKARRRSERGAPHGKSRRAK